jgi:tryptophan-rich sensory protein
MEYIYVLFPFIAVGLTRIGVKKPSFDDQIKISYGTLFWLAIAACVGVAGYDVYKLNDQVTTTAFLILCWLLGNGYVIVTTMSKVPVNLAYAAVLFGVTLFLIERLNHFGKFMGQYFLIPMLIWSSFLLAKTTRIISPQLTVPLIPNVAFEK